MPEPTQEQIERSKVGDPERPLGTPTVIYPKVYSEKNVNVQPERDYWLQREQQTQVQAIVDSNIQRMGGQTMALAPQTKRRSW